MDARSAAEARRAKILAKAKQRIDSLTVGSCGEWRGPEEQAQLAPQGAPVAPSQAAPTPTPAQPFGQAPEQAAPAPTQQASESASPQQPDEWVHVPSMPASTSQLEHVELHPHPSPTHEHSSQAPPRTSAEPTVAGPHDPTQHAQPPQSLPQQQSQPQQPQPQQQEAFWSPPASAELHNRHQPSNAGARDSGSTSVTAPTTARGALHPEAPSTDEVLPGAGTAGKAIPAAPSAAPVLATDAPLNAAVRVSRLIRCVVAVCYAYSLSHASWESDSRLPMLPPLLVLTVVQLAIIFAIRKALLMPDIQHALGGKLHTLLPSGEVAVPAKLAGLDMWGFLLRLSPELRALVASAASAAGVCKGMLDSMALFLVAFVLTAPRTAAR